jgi:3'-phosphoadenosine 5'-phosphosulfate sulfotransferase (PAPS reductase)/FAD synthetase
MKTLIPTPTASAWKALTLDAQLALVADNARRCRANLVELADAGAMFVVSHSGGKDSQMLALFIEAIVPASQIVYVHATLGRFEWQVIEHIEATIAGELHIAQAITRAGADKSFGDMVLARGMFPSPQQRQCTSDLKRGPIAKVVRRLSKERGELLIVECTGVRADESVARRRSCVESFSFDKANSKAGRTWYKAAPLADWTTAEVFAEIERRGQTAHPIYAAGMSRLSCCFCIMASKSDQRIAAQLNPELFAELVAIEQHIGHTMSMSQQTLEQVTGLEASPVAVRRHLNVLRSAA